LLLFNKLLLCPYMVRKHSISVIRTWQISYDIRKSHIWKCTADFLSQFVWWPFWKARQFEQCFPDSLTSWKKLSTTKCSQKVNKYFPQLTEKSRGWLGIFSSENSTKKMLLRTKQLTCSRKVVKLRRLILSLIHRREDLFSIR